MHLETKFGNGDKVWHIKQDWQYEWRVCGFCGGRGLIRGANNDEAFCPRCIDKGGWNEQRMLAWGVVEGPLTIGEIRVRVRGEDDGGNIKFLKEHVDPHLPFGLIPNNYGPQEDEYEEQYMCKETGIGAGQLYDADTLFATEAEALKECRERNKNPAGAGSSPSEGRGGGEVGHAS